MVLQSGSTYYNDTALDPLSSTDVEIQYNINATDIAGNIALSSLEIITLDDPTPPQILEYGVTDYRNGTLEFFANISDDSGVESATLRLNDTYVSMIQNSSNYWVYRDEFYYGSTWNYTIWSTKDNLGNENGSITTSLNPSYKLVVVNDETNPQIWGIQHTFFDHNEGQVEFTALVDDWNNYQSQVNISTVKIILEINGLNQSFFMSKIGDITYFYEYTFNYDDTVYFWIQAMDLAGNLNLGLRHGPYIISDNSPPSVSYWADEFGNGTIDFFARVIDWPNNLTNANLLYSINYPATWINVSMVSINSTLYTIRISDFSYQEQDIWYYVSALDSAGNSYTPEIDEALNISLSDKICPEITYVLIQNSTVVDGQITVYVRAEDPFGASSIVNNTFYLSYQVNSSLNIVEMNYYSFYTYSYTLVFLYQTTVNLSIWVADNAGNTGNWNKSIVIQDNSAPKILQHGCVVYQNGSVSIWTEVYESVYGSGLSKDNTSVRLTYIYQTTSSVVMNWNGSGNYYSFLISGFEPGKAFTYQIIVTDNEGNTNQTEWEPVSISDETPPIFTLSDPIQVWTSHYCVNISFLVEAYDLFGEIDYVLINISIDGQSFSLATMSKITDFYRYTVLIECERNLSYQIVVFDKGGNSNRSSLFHLVTLDYKPATISSFGVEYNRTCPGSIRFWTLVDNPW
ncbi:MAG: hypothetical protein ACTSPV_17095, partial [Candidatus Hodarchaeales archaeon]